MPSIEIVSLEQEVPIAFSGLPFAVVTDAKPVSHRSPRPLFQREIAGIRGCTYHVGSPFCQNSDYGGPYFAYEILSTESRERLRGRFFEVDQMFRDAFAGFLHQLLISSPIRSVFFFTDWQMGPKQAVRGGVLSERSFWRQHDSHKLKLNACYTIRESA